MVDLSLKLHIASTHNFNVTILCYNKQTVILLSKSVVLELYTVRFSPGRVGSAGVAGEPGPTGAVGATGFAGGEGAAGSAGVSGNQGPNGRRGATGVCSDVRVRAH